MKKFALALMASAALVFGFGAVAQAQYGSASVTFNVSSATPGQTITISITGCTPGETITVSVNGAVVGTAICQASALTQGSLLGLGLVQQTATSATAARSPPPPTPGTYRSSSPATAASVSDHADGRRRCDDAGHHAGRRSPCHRLVRDGHHHGYRHRPPGRRRRAVLRRPGAPSPAQPRLTQFCTHGSFPVTASPSGGAVALFTTSPVTSSPGA